jgi:outer membrane protein assembly factor BamB
VIAASETRLAALRANDGTIVWQRDSGLQRHRGAIDGNTLFVPLAAGRIQAVDLADGKVRWEATLGGSPAEPLVVGDRLYVGATDKQFYCLNTSNGGIEWHRTVGASISGRPTSDGERVFFVGLDNLVRGINRGSGSLVWQEGIPYRPFGTLAVADSSLVVAGQMNEIRLLNVATGKQAARIQVPERLVTAPAVGTLSTGEAVIAVVTGGLNESWKLWLASPADAAAAKADAKTSQSPSN